jgi:hypothetical protein
MLLIFVLDGCKNLEQSNEHVDDVDAEAERAHRTHALGGGDRAT